MSRPPRSALPTNNRERLKLDFTRAALLRQMYPQLAEVRVEFEFQDGTTRSPSPQSFSYFPAARGFFRYACPCHSCSGEFDISNHVAELASKAEKAPRIRHVKVTCTGLRAHESNERVPCPICASVNVSATLRTTE
jgi:hypothetical protein